MTTYEQASGVQDPATPLYDELVATVTTTSSAYTPPEPDPGSTLTDASAVLTLFARMKVIEEADGSWPGADVVDELSEWFEQFGVDVEADVDTAAASLRVPAYVAAALLTPLRDGDLTVHVRAGGAETFTAARPHLTALLSALPADSAASVFDHTGAPIAHLLHPAAATDTQ